MKKTESKLDAPIIISDPDKHAPKDKTVRKKLIKTAILCVIAAAAVFYISTIIINFERMEGTGITTSVYYGDYYITHYMSKTDDIDFRVNFSERNLSDSVVNLIIYTQQSKFGYDNPHYDIENLTATIRLVGKCETHSKDPIYSTGGEIYQRPRWSSYDTTELTGSFGSAIEWICECPEDYCEIEMPICEIEGDIEVHLYLNYDIVGNGLYSWNTFRGQSQEIVHTISHS